MNIIEAIQKAGVAGCGGAGFPTHMKLKGDIKTLIVNGLECEPLLRTDRYIMRHFAPQLIDAVTLLARETGASAVIALKRTYTQEISALEAAKRAANADVEIKLIDSYYPAGDEQAVVYEVTGKTVPPANIPLAVGAAVINAATMIAVHSAVNDAPFTRKFLTLNGAVGEPSVLYMPLGASFSDCIKLAGGALRDDCVLVEGGPMMGKRFRLDEADKHFVSKTTSGILVLPEDTQPKVTPITAQLSRARSVCIQCSYCTQMCPRYLMGHPLEPHKIMRKLAYSPLDGLLNDPVIRSAALCCECGVCEVYACPMGLQPRTLNAMIRRALGEAGIRYGRAEESTEPNPMRELRRVPTKRVASRAGVLEYYHNDLDRLKTGSVERVCEALKQSAGVPAEPVVAVGDVVSAGQLIAKCPDGKLGVPLHASISGRVSAITDAITIEREE